MQLMTTLEVKTYMIVRVVHSFIRCSFLLLPSRTGTASTVAQGADLQLKSLALQRRRGGEVTSARYLAIPWLWGTCMLT